MGNIKDSARECQAQCQGMGNCVGWTWKTDSHQCWLKDRVDPMHYDSISVSGTCTGSGPSPTPSPPSGHSCPAQQNMDNGGANIPPYGNNNIKDSARCSAREWATVLAGLGKRTAVNVGSRTALIRCIMTASRSVGLARDQVHHPHRHHHQGTVAQLNRTWTMVGRTFRRMGTITSKIAPENVRRSAREWATVLAGLGKRTAINAGSRTALIRCIMTAFRSVGPVSRSIGRGSPQTAPKTCGWKPCLLIAF